MGAPGFVEQRLYAEARIQGRSRALRDIADSLAAYRTHFILFEANQFPAVELDAAGDLTAAVLEEAQ